MTYPMAFNLLQRELKEHAAEMSPAQGLLYRTELAILVWEYLTFDLRYDFSPATYRAMRKILRPYMEWILENCGEDSYYRNRARFFLALTSDTVPAAKQELDAIQPSSSRANDVDQDQRAGDIHAEAAFIEAVHALRSMLDEHEKACGKNR